MDNSCLNVDMGFRLDEYVSHHSVISISGGPCNKRFMETTENLQKILSWPRFETVTNESLRPLVFETVKALIKEGGFTQCVYAAIGGLFVGRGESVETFLDEKISVGQLKWVDGILVEDISKMELSLTSEEEEALRRLVNTSGEQPIEIVRRLIRKGVIENEG